MKRMFQRLAILAVVAGVAMTQGCASLYLTKQHDRSVMAQNAIKLQASPGGAMVSIDLLSLGTGWWATAKDWTAGTIAAGTVDVIGTALLGYGTYRVYDHYYGDDGDSGSSVQQSGQTIGLPSGGLSVGGNNNIVAIGQRITVSVPSSVTSTDTRTDTSTVSGP